MRLNFQAFGYIHISITCPLSAYMQSTLRWLSKQIAAQTISANKKETNIKLNSRHRFGYVNRINRKKLIFQVQVSFFSCTQGNVFSPAWCPVCAIELEPKVCVQTSSADRQHWRTSKHCEILSALRRSLGSVGCLFFLLVFLLEV